jgi:hypothetical protein
MKHGGIFNTSEIPQFRGLREKIGENSRSEYRLSKKEDTWRKIPHFIDMMLQRVVRAMH